MLTMTAQIMKRKGGGAEMDRLIGGASTQSRCRRPIPEGWNPQVVKRSGVTEAWLVNGKVKSMLTYVFDQGGPLLGYSSRMNRYSKPVLLEVERAIKNGMLGPGSVASQYEYETTDLICDILAPYLTDGKGELAVRWLANGSDILDCSLRLARAITRRNKYISIGYHGSSIVFAHEPQNKGVPSYIYKDRIDMDFGDFEALENIDDKVSCIIVEVPSEDAVAEDFLKACRKFCDDTGAIFILDELVTGFRLGIGGAAQRYDVKPDLACYGKAMSNGRGIAALLGWPKIMNQLVDKVFYSNTFNGDPLNLAFVKGTLNYLRTHEYIYEHIWEMGEKLRNMMESAGIEMVGHAPRMDMAMPYDKKRYDFCVECVRRGVVINRPFYIALPLKDKHLEQTAEAVEECMSL